MRKILSETFFILKHNKTSKLSNSVLHQFGGLHKLCDTPDSLIITIYQWRFLV